MGSGSPDSRPQLLVIESDQAVCRVLEAHGRDRFRFHFAESLSDRILARQWGEAIERPLVSLIEIPDTRLETFARLSQFRRSIPEMSTVLTVCYDCDYQLAAERLHEMSERVVFRPFEAEPVILTLLGLSGTKANKVTGGTNG